MPNTAVKNGFYQKSYIKQFGLYIMLFLCIFIPFRSPLADLTIDSIKIIPDLMILSLFCWYIVSEKFHVKILLQDWLFAGFLTIGLISNVVNGVGIAPYIFQVRSISTYYVLYFVLRNLNFGKSEFIRITNTLQFSTVTLFVFAIIEKITLKTVLFPVSQAENIIYPSNFARVYSMFYNPNTFGAFLIFVFIFSIAKYCYYNSKTPAYIYIILVVSLLLSMSRSTMIAFVASLIIFIILFICNKGIRINWKSMLSKVAIIILSSLIVFTTANKSMELYYNNVISIVNANPDQTSEAVTDNANPDPTSEADTDNANPDPTSEADTDNANPDQTSEAGTVAFNSMEFSIVDRMKETGDSSMYDRSSSNGRLYSIKKGLEVFQDHLLLGSGFGTFGSAASLNWTPKIYEKYDISKGFYSDNEYIKVVAETGAIGTLLFGGFLLYILYRYRKDWLKILICILVGWLGMFYNVFEVQIVAMLLWVFLSFKDLDIKAILRE